MTEQEQIEYDIQKVLERLENDLEELLKKHSISFEEIQLTSFFSDPNDPLVVATMPWKAYNPSGE